MASDRINSRCPDQHIGHLHHLPFLLVTLIGTFRTQTTTATINLVLKFEYSRSTNRIVCYLGSLWVTLVGAQQPAGCYYSTATANTRGKYTAMHSDGRGNSDAKKRNQRACCYGRVTGLIQDQYDISKDNFKMSR